MDDTTRDTPNRPNRPKLRSNFEPGSPLWAMRRTHWKALGISDEDMEKPKIAVVNSSSELAICFSHLDEVAVTVKQAVLAAGGLPFEIRTTAPSDFIICAGRGGGYILPSRDLIVNDIEVAVEGAVLQTASAERGTLSREDLIGMTDNAVRGPGVCSGMGTANSMHVVAESLGMSLPGSAPVLANS